MSKPLVILGTHWLAEEVHDLISEMPEWRVEAFVENMDPERCKLTIDGLPVIWVDELKAYSESHLAICALGNHASQPVRRAGGRPWDGFRDHHTPDRAGEREGNSRRGVFCERAVRRIHKGPSWGSTSS